MRQTIPHSGRPHEELLDEMRAFGSEDARYRDGRTWSLVYWPGDAHHEFLKQAHDLYLSANLLNPMAFRSLRRMEAEVVQMTAEMLHGPPSTVGTMTSGGTESILLAVKAYRDRARRRRPWVRRPNLVAPRTAHVAFDKAGHYFDVRVKRARTDADGRADVGHMARLVDRNTVMLVGSAPQYPHGVVDPIPEIGALAQRKRLPLHVDACFGGFLLPWLERLGVPMPTWDYRVPGVTSISADVHKYGYAAKGASTITYRDMRWLKHQFFVASGWPGGIYISPGMGGTRPGGPIAAAWASLQALGEDGFLRLTRGAWEAAERLRAGIREIPELRVLGLPHSTVVTWAARDDAVDVYAVADQLQARGWGVDRQQEPPSVHCSISAGNVGVVQEYLDDLRAAVAHVRTHPELATEGEAAVYGLMAKVPVDRLVNREVRKIMESMYAPDAVLPDLAAADAEGPPPIVRRALDTLDAIRRRLGR